MALEVQKSCRTSHGADRGNEGHALAGIKNGASCVCLDSDIRFLCPDGLAWLLGIWVFVKFLADLDEVRLPRRACILAPEPFEVDCADVAASGKSSEGSIDLLEVVVSGAGIVLIAAYVRAHVIHAGLHGIVDRIGFTIVGIWDYVFRLCVCAFLGGEGDGE